MTTTVYIAASVNRNLHAATISPSSQVLFGSHKFVACWDTADDFDRGVSETVPGHEHEVTAVKWIEDGVSFCSGDQGGALVFWTRNSQQIWDIVHKVQAQTRAISALATYGHLVVAGSSDSELKVYSYDHKASAPPTLLQTLDLKSRYPLDIQIASLPGSNALVMAVATTDRNIRIFTRSDEQFVSSLSLEGHEDWVKCLAFSTISSTHLYLASGSQDGYVRLWLITTSTAAPIPNASTTPAPIDELMDAFERSLGEMDEDTEEGGKKISNRSHVFAVNDTNLGSKQYSLTFDALLIGHEAGVTSLSWQPTPNTLPTLLSTSTDSSLILWSPSDVPVAPSSSSPGAAVTASLWMNRQRFGDVGGVKPGGFVGGIWGRNGKEVLGFGWNGSWRRWRNTSTVEAKYGDGSPREVWKEVPAVVGHSGPVRGLAWDPRGDYVVSTSLDQTTRIHGPWRRQVSVDAGATSQTVETWHEISRPQIHGYDLIAATWLGSLKLVSVADEKVARVFDAPKGFVKTLSGLNTAQGVDLEVESRPIAAVVPPLGLSNKATEDNSTETSALVAQDDSSEMYRRPPLEPELGALTLWPESEKIFGHGYELLTVASSHDGKLLATSCKSTTAEHAVVRLYDTATWKSIGQPLAGHALTITRITFSPDDKLILTVSRDRTWRLFQKNEDGGFNPLCSEKPHARVIWDCAWASEGDIFATAARDKTVKIWQSDGDVSKKWKLLQTLTMNDAATAVDFLTVGGDLRLAVGVEGGQVHIFEASLAAPDSFKERLVLDQSVAHVGQIHRLAWRPSQEGQRGSGLCDLAICSEDRSLRVVRITFP